MDYESWEQSVPTVISDDALWTTRVYRLALFAADVEWEDVTRLAQDRRTAALSDQLCRAVGSISANIAEGYSRGSSRDRARFYEYALGSAREARDWYYKSRHVLKETTVDDRLSLLTEVTRLLLTMIRDQRGYAVREETPAYVPDSDAPA